MSSAYFGLILRGLARTSSDRAALLDGTGLTPAADSGLAEEISLGQQLRQVRNANAVAKPDWPLRMSASFHPLAHGPMGLAVASAPTLRKSVEAMTRFSQVRAPHFRLRAQNDGHEVRLLPQDQVDLEDAERVSLLDIVMISSQHLLESCLGRPMSEGRFELPFAAPDHARSYESCLNAPVHFGCREAAIVLPAAWLDCKNPLADEVAWQLAWRRLEAGEVRLHGGGFVGARVERILLTRGTAVSADAAAALLGMSRRTLVRRLAQEGTSYAELVDGARRTRAELLLQRTHRSVAEIAEAVGYRDAANFGRACRRWTGMSPGAWRRSLRSMQ